MVNVLVNKAARELALKVFNAGEEKALFTKVSPKALENLNSFIVQTLAKVAADEKKVARSKKGGTTITLDALVAAPQKPKTKRTVQEQISDHAAAQVSVMEHHRASIRNLERQVNYLYGLLAPKFNTDNMRLTQIDALMPDGKKDMFLQKHYTRK